MEEYPSKMDETKFSLDNYLKQGETFDEDNWNKLDNSILHRFSMEYLSKAPLDVIRRFLKNYDELYSFKGIVDLIKTYYDRKAKEFLATIPRVR